MSYCRFTEGDVYAYACDGGVQFYVSDGKRELDRLCSTFNEAYQYARVLRDMHGLDVPSYAIEALKADAIEEAAHICGPDSAVAELKEENAELWELAEKLWELAESRKWVARMLGQQTARVVNLQELARDMFDGMCDHDRCNICPHWREGYNGCEYYERMAQLGVEVD